MADEPRENLKCWYNDDEVAEVVEAMSLPFEPSGMQLQDIETMARYRRGSFLYDVGGGKTFVSTATAKLWDTERNLIICPPILLEQWKAWLNSVNENDVSIYAGTRRKPEDLQHKWVLMSHAIFRNDHKKIEAAYADKGLTTIVDEAHALKNPRSNLFRCVWSLVGADRPIILLTATPTSKPEDMYAYTKLQTPRVYRSFTHWANCHVGNRDFFGNISSYKNLESAAEAFHLSAIKRTKKELFGYNLDPIYQPIRYSLSSEHYRLYSQLVEEQLLLLPNGEKIDATTAQRLRHKLQQIVLDLEKFSGVPGKLAAGFELLDQVLDEVRPEVEENSKLCIWTYYKSSSARVYSYLQEKFGEDAVAAAYSEVDSRKSVDRIMNDPKCRILVGQPTSVGVGLNLQHVSSEMLFLEQAAVPLQARQAIGRVDRAGQTVRPTIRFALANGTIQIRLFNDLLRNDEVTSKVERTLKSLRAEIYGE